MRLMKQESRYYAECHTDSDGYENDNTYIFPSEEELQKFLGMRDDYENHHYYSGIDIYGEEKSLGYYESVECVYSKTEYNMKYED